MASFTGMLGVVGALVLVTPGPGLAQRPAGRSPSGSVPQVQFAAPDLVPAIRRSSPFPSPSGYSGSSISAPTQNPTNNSNAGWTQYYNYYPHYGETRNGYPYYSPNYPPSSGYSGSYLDSVPGGYGTNSNYYGYSRSYLDAVLGDVTPGRPSAYNRSAGGYPPTTDLPLQYQPTVRLPRTAAPGENSTNIIVKVPPNAEVWFDQTKTTSSGPVREYRTPSLAPDRRYTYEVRARWEENGSEITQTQKVQFLGGSPVEVSFPTPSGTAGQAR
jgi:uncharacterized protein (TIGR03000 family)